VLEVLLEVQLLLVLVVSLKSGFGKIGVPKNGYTSYQRAR